MILLVLLTKESCAAIFVDLSKAFDTVDHNILLKCLSKIGMSVNAIEWFKNYLSSRYQCVTCEGIMSGETGLIVGVLSQLYKKST